MPRNSWVRALPIAILTLTVLSGGLLPHVGCSSPATGGRGDDGSSGEVEDGSSTGTVARPYTVDVLVEADAIEVLNVQPYADIAKTPPPVYRDPSLVWWIEDAAGEVVDGGVVADPRYARADPGPDGEPSILSRVESAMLRIDTQVDEGTLVVTEVAPSVQFRNDGCNPQNHEVGRDDLASESGGSGPSTTVPGLSKLIDNCDCAFGVNLLFVSEGFTQAQLGDFRQRVRSLANGLRNYAGFKDHWDQVNVWVLEVASPDSGISDPDNGITKSTPFGVSFGQGSDRRCVFPRNPTSAATRLRSRAESEARSLATMIVANSNEHGGCATRGLATTTLGPHAQHTVIHELGHALFNLADEYVDASRCDISRAGNRLNTTKNAGNPPWRSIVGTTFEGAEYCATGVYRAEQRCLMRDTTPRFCSVCSHHANRWFEERKWTRPDSSCGAEPSPSGDCFAGTPCPSGTLCAWNGPDVGYCCKEPFEGSETCFSDDGCSDGQVCSAGGPPDDRFYCMTPDESLCVAY